MPAVEIGSGALSDQDGHEVTYGAAVELLVAPTDHLLDRLD